MAFRLMETIVDTDNTHSKSHPMFT